MKEKEKTVAKFHWYSLVTGWKITLATKPCVSWLTCLLKQYSDYENNENKGGWYPG